ncbi:MAG: hypothetical protein WBM13_09620 [Bacteroidia bacterium]
MKKILFLVISFCISSTYAQRQVAITGNVEYGKNKFMSYPQTAFGVLYRQKQNTYGATIDNIGTDFNTIFKTDFYNIVGATGFYYRHLNKNKLSGVYAGALISYTQFAQAYGNKVRYNEVPEPPNPWYWWCGTGGISLPYQYRQFKAIPVLGYEYYPCNRFSIYAEAGYGLLYLKTKMTTDMFDSRVIRNAENIYGNLNFKVGIKTVLYHRSKEAVKQ